MKVISVIEDEDVIKKILKHLRLWDQKSRPVYVHHTGRPPPKVNSPSMTPEYPIDYMDSQLPASDNYLYVTLNIQRSAWPDFGKQMGPRDSSTRISSISPSSGKITPPDTVSTSTPFMGPHPHFKPDSCPHNIL